ncbi:MAG TPA: CGNR zinc finger domain-containing protein [Gemmatimonadaceae bacterium]|nr:CGNR zinc finger domain-containing protein [Gemmatimonadaceae bacterium]
MPRPWISFINTEAPAAGDDALASFDAYVAWLELAEMLDAERGVSLRRRAVLQPAGATAALLDARRMRAALRALAERGAATDKSRSLALAEINRVLGRSAGMRRIEQLDDGRFVRSFVAAGDAFAGLLIPLVESATDSLVRGELGRVRWCANPRCHRVFFDASRNGRRRWCDMKTCGNRAKAARHRRREKRS